MDHAIQLLAHYVYLILFPLAVIEGPIITVIAGFLCNNGLMNPIYAYLTVIAGDMVGDSFYYALGRWSQSAFFQKISRKLGITTNKLERVKKYISANPYKSISLSKVVLGVGIAGLFLAGQSKIPFGKYLIVCAITAAVQSAVYLVIGYFFGAFYHQISHYLNYFAGLAIVVTLIILLFLFIRSKLKAKFNLEEDIIRKD